MKDKPSKWTWKRITLSNGETITVETRKPTSKAAKAIRNLLTQLQCNPT